mmetsp:Transcript_12787/g.38019  ORF Transcript_12787/g.38019 Transcript_12787/m.38019 type:complete len:214 (+) Transcript_12787:846-1487(+)
MGGIRLQIRRAFPASVTASLLSAIPWDSTCARTSATKSARQHHGPSPSLGSSTMYQSLTAAGRGASAMAFALALAFASAAAFACSASARFASMGSRRESWARSQTLRPPLGTGSSSGSSTRPGRDPLEPARSAGSSSSQVRPSLAAGASSCHVRPSFTAGFSDSYRDSDISVAVRDMPSSSSDSSPSCPAFPEPEPEPSSSSPLRGVVSSSWG